MMDHNRRVGAEGETLAKNWLTAQGLIFVAQNVRTEAGEIDLIFQGADGLHFVEVKTRTTQKLGYPEEAITGQKAQRLVDCAECYLDVTGIEQDVTWQVDVLSITLEKGRRPRIRWIQDALRDE